MTTHKNYPKHHFDVHASVVLQLGENLITDEAQALVELVKNAYDADANYARVIVDTEAKPEDGAFYQDAAGYISIEDDGIGMDEDTIRRGWLTVSNSPKREMKRKGLTTERGRTPLGDKGLGRLCAQRLASNVEIFTRPKGSAVEYHVAFSWDSFLEENVSLTQVPVIFEVIEPPQRIQGTKLVISGLKDNDFWRGHASNDLKVKLSQLFSPYKEVRDFKVAAIVNGKRLDLAEYSIDLKKTAILNYKLDFDEKEFRVKGKAKLDFFKPDFREEEEIKQDYRSFIESDGGSAFFDFLASLGQAERYHLKKSAEENWYIEFEYSRKLIQIDKVKLLDGKPANPGQFHGEIDSFKYSDSPSSYSYGTDSVIRNFVRELGGIRVYRDGFGIRTDSDILELRKQQTSGRSFYGLRPENITGYIALSAKYNAVLEEKTDREGFQASPYYDNFYLLLRECAKFTLDVQSFLRRGRNEFFKKRKGNVTKLLNQVKTEELASEIHTELSSAEAHGESLRKTRETLEHVTKEAQQIVKFADEIFPPNTARNQSIHATTQSFTQEIERARKEVTQVEAYLHDIPDLQRKVVLLSDQLTLFKNQIAILGEQLSQTYETVSLGLTAEALSHEIATITDRLAYRNRQTMDYLVKQNIKDMILISFTQYINTTIASLRKQLSHLEPSLRYVRENREKIIVLEYFKEVEEYYKSRLEAHNIEIQIKSVEENNKFVLFMNRGKLNQIMDNLLLNSEYWLREDLRLKFLARGIITIEISKPFVRISDNGRGIEPSVEKSLFEPFVTTKGQGRGRGLGLFIVQQLLESENCTISLLPNRNKRNRLYIFEINFTGGLSGSK